MSCSIRLSPAGGRGVYRTHWAEIGHKLPPEPDAGPEKPVKFDRAVTAGWKLDPAPVGVLPNGPGRYVVFGKQKALLVPTMSAIADAGMTLRNEVCEPGGDSRWARWGVEVEQKSSPRALRTLDSIVWGQRWVHNESNRTSIHPTITLVRALAYKAIRAGWPRLPRGAN